MTDISTLCVRGKVPLYCLSGLTVLAPALPWRFTSRDLQALSRCMYERNRRGLRLPEA